MKVLEKGPGWGLEILCTGKGNGGGGCGAKLLVERGDVYLTHSYDYGGGHDVYYTCRCPECGIETDIDERKIPGKVRDEAIDKDRALNLSR